MLNLKNTIVLINFFILLVPFQVELFEIIEATTNILNMPGLLITKGLPEIYNKETDRLH